jgi:2,3-bisphosphoglycerate-dependent phosphoglycerate mutase
LIWRRSYDIPPPEMSEDDERHPKHDPRYAHLPSDVLPKTESLKLTVDRVLPYWYDRICP